MLTRLHYKLMRSNDPPRARGYLYKSRPDSIFFLEDFLLPKENAFLREIQIKLQLASNCTGTPDFQAGIIHKEEGGLGKSR